MPEATVSAGDLGSERDDDRPRPSYGPARFADRQAPPDSQVDASGTAAPSRPIYTAPPAPRKAPVTRPLTADDWAREEEFWSTQSHIAISGRLAVPRPRTRPIRPPQRFRPIERWKSIAALVFVAALIALTCAGAMRATGFANNLLHPRAVPTQPHPSPTASPARTATSTPKPRR